MLELDYTDQGRRPSAAQIIADWKKAGRPREFEVVYGETYAQFEAGLTRWHDYGNGCRGVDRDAVLKRLNEVES